MSLLEILPGFVMPGEIFRVDKLHDLTNEKQAILADFFVSGGTYSFRQILSRGSPGVSAQKIMAQLKNADSSVVSR